MGQKASGLSRRPGCLELWQLGFFRFMVLEIPSGAGSDDAMIKQRN